MIITKVVVELGQCVLKCDNTNLNLTFKLANV